jgi:hypothetical protein
MKRLDRRAVPLSDADMRSAPRDERLTRGPRRTAAGRVLRTVLLGALAAACNSNWEALHPRDAAEDGPTASDVQVDSVRDAPGCTPREQNLTLSAAEDDGELYMSSFHPDGEGTPMGLNAGAGIGAFVWVFLRFRLADAIPANARIDDVRLSLWGVSTFRWTPSADALSVLAELTPDAAVVAGGLGDPLRPARRTLTLSAVRWPDSGGLPWMIDATNDSTDLSPLVRELVSSNGGLGAGRHVQFWLRRTDTTHEAQVVISTFVTPDFHAARLSIRACQ